MKLHEIDDEILDSILVKLCKMIVDGQQNNPKYYGLVAACVLDVNDNQICGVNYPDKNGNRIHAERVAINAYHEKFGEIPQGSIIVTTLSPCDSFMDDRHGKSCTDLINDYNFDVYCGYIDPTQSNTKNNFDVKETKNKKLRKLCKSISDTFLNSI